MSIELVESPTRANVINVNLDKKCIRCKEDGATQSGFCLKCVGTNLRFNVPREDEFDEETGEFIVSPELEKIGTELIAKYDELAHLEAYRLIYLWKKTGGKSGGKLTLGKCQRPSGLLKHFSNTDFIIWLGADNTQQCTEFQITALVFHELKHAQIDEKGNPVVVGHDFEGFAREVEIFGNWKSDITQMKKAFDKAEQMELFR
jgi:hypothetical protein